MLNSHNVHECAACFTKAVTQKKNVTETWKHIANVSSGRTGQKQYNAAIPGVPGIKIDTAKIALILDSNNRLSILSYDS